MPFPTNWLKELVAEWLELEFLTLITLRLPGMNQIPDMVGVKVLAGGQAVIRHCEASQWFAGGVPNTLATYQNKFSPRVEQAVRDEFSRYLGVSMASAAYERWIICVECPGTVQTAFQTGLPPHTLRTLGDFLSDVEATIDAWSNARQVPGSVAFALPADKWLLKLMSYMTYVGWRPRGGGGVP